MKKYWVPVLVGMLYTSVFALEPITVKIGHAGPLSGPIAHLGKDSQHGALMAIEALNAKGVSINGHPVRFVLTAEDDGGDPKHATAAAQKLVDEKVMGVVGHITSGTSIPASAIYASAGLPEVAPSVTSMGYNAQGYASLFRVVANDQQIGTALAQYALTDLQAKKVVVIDDRTAYGQGIADQFVKALKIKSPHIHIAPRLFTTDKAVDFNPLLIAAKRAQPDVIFLGAMDATAGPLLRQMKALGIQTKLMSGDGICTEQLIALAGDALKDNQVVCAMAGGVLPSEKKAFDTFLAAYEKRFGQPVQLYAPYNYDAVMVIAAAMQHAQSADPAVYLPFLRNIRYKGITGDIMFDSKGNLLHGIMTLYTYRSHRRIAIKVIQ